MSLDGPAFYDKCDIFQTYQSHRSRPENPNDTLEKPTFLELVGNVSHKRILDLGCGDAGFGRQALDRECSSYVGVEGSRNMVALAQRTLAGTLGQVIHADLETWPFPKNAFDLVVSRLVLQYLSALEPILGGIFDALDSGGGFIFSVEHPVITSCDRAWQGQGPRQDWIVDNYFDTGARDPHWLGGQVRKYHRTVEDYFLALQRAGFIVESIREARPQRVNFMTEETYLRRMRIPLFLLMAGKKP
jgi:SAM-dependent methyltransferase